MAGTAEEPRRLLAYDRADANKRRALLLLLLFAVVSLPAALFLAVYLVFFFAVLVGMTLGMFAVGGAFPGEDWTLIAVLVVGTAVSLALLAPVVVFLRAAALVLRLAHAKPVPAGEQPELRRTVENLCIGSGLPQPSLYLVYAAAPNAFSTGLSPGGSSIVVTTGLLALLDRRQLEGVLAHELAQIGNYDTRIQTVLAAGVAFLRLPFTAVATALRFLFRVHWLVGGFVFLYLGLPMLASMPLGFALGLSMLDEDPEQGLVVLATMSLPVYALVLAPLLAEVIRAGVSREQQFLADADAVLLARNAEPLATALVEMDAAGMAGLGAARSTGHIWTVDPVSGRPWWDRIWPDYHPPVSQRVHLIAGTGSGISESALEAARERGMAFAPGQTGKRVPPAPRVVAAPPQADAGSDGDAGHPAYRLTAPETPVFESADQSSPVIARLAPGSLITVHAEAGSFLHVITPGDRFGYILRDAEMLPVKLPGLDASSPGELGRGRLFPGVLLVPLALLMLLTLEVLGDNVPCFDPIEGC